ncbi:hypothetical protein ACKUB1_15355 [Methanospirillum stamsii]|uniref:Uncharacterized protein n=1 Tax=Methanospirillum stamsii TaxID=1277351 RepID=A0A2V2N932_9EURY|nr:hypothetical protein [Methanospirillum stamsii]PWR75210.1 hypothetical protein DLD82_05300 [Methanospirillum stamsii]
MKFSYAIGSILFALSFLVFPSCAGELTLTDDEKAFLTDMEDMGIPMLYQIPEAMNIGVYHGRDTAISDIATSKTEELKTFSDKISGYTLGTETSVLRDSWLDAEQILKTDLEQYGTLVSGCGSCVSTMNAMYPVLTQSAGKVNKDLIRFYEKNQIPL